MANEYSSQFVPPAPTLKIRLSAPFESPQTPELLALVDTGADFSLAPLDLLLELNAQEVREAQVRGLWSEPRHVTLFSVDLHIETGTLPNVYVAGIDEEQDTDEIQIIIGRNALNRLILLLDGPSEQVDILTMRPRRI